MVEVMSKETKTDRHVNKKDVQLAYFEHVIPKTNTKKTKRN